MDTSISSLVFGKDLTALTLADLKQYFQEPRMESNIVEFKSFHSLAAGSGKEKEDFKNILRSIVAFSNSEGGVLVWGAPKGDPLPGQKEPVFQGELTPGAVSYEKDAFIGSVANRIIPSPRNVLFHRLDVQGKYVYVLEIPPSDFGPHQLENIYYMRMDGQTHAAPHHYIEAMFRKISFPKLEAYLRIDGYKMEGDQNTLWATLIFRNQSRYQNDEDLRCKISSDHGRVQPLSDVIQYQEGMLRAGSHHDSGIFAKTVYYGNYLHYPFKIRLSPNALHDRHYEIVLEVVFGARYSPMKINRYKIVVGPNFPKECNDAIAYKKENAFFHEDEKDRGMTDEDILQRILRDHSYDPSK